MDLPGRALRWSLRSFNTGMQIGQLLIVTVVATILAAAGSQRSAASRRLTTLGSVAITVASVVWFVQRLLLITQ